MDALPRWIARFAFALVALAVIGFAASPASAAVTVRTFEEVVDLEGQNLLVIDLGIGSVDVVPGTSERVEISAEILCSRFNRRCRRQAEELELAVDRRSASIALKAAGYGRIHVGAPPQVNVVVHAPAGLEIEIDLGVGDVDVRGLNAKVDVDLGVGDVDVHLESVSAGSVDIDVGVGSATIEPGHSRVRRSGFLIFGNEVRWRGGTGSADVQIDVGVGSAAVTID